MSWENEGPAAIEGRLVALMLTFPRAIHAVADIVQPEHFAGREIRSLFVAAKESFGAIGEHDIVDIARRSSAAGWTAGSIAELIRSAESTDTFAGQRAREVVSAWERRETVRVIQSAAAEAECSTEDPATLRQRLTDRLGSVGATRRRGPRSAREIVPEVLSGIDRRMSGDHGPSGLKTGLLTLDAMTGGMRPGELVILAARPGMGKSALALNIAEVVSILRRQPTLFISLEMSEDELTQRLLSAQANLHSSRVRQATMSADERAQLGEAAERVVADAALTIDASAGISVAHIAAAAHRQAASPAGLAFVVIDYVQLIEPANRREPRQEQVSTISRELKQLAKRLNVPILCLAQLNRQVESRTDHRPRKSDLRESGSIEQDADVVLLIHRESEMLTETDRSGLDRTAVLIVDKNRHGPTGDIYLRWLPTTMQFIEVAT